jgi:hypothetical protein
MSPAREVLVVERVPELTAFFEALVSKLGDDVRLTIEPDAARAQRLAVEGGFDLVIRDAAGMLALVDQIVRVRKATESAESTLAVDNRW